jgi:hypothetical protein
MKPENHSCKSPYHSDPNEPWNCIECGQSFSGTVMPMQVFRETDAAHSDFVQYAIIAIGGVVIWFLGISAGLCLSELTR